MFGRIQVKPSGPGLFFAGNVWLQAYLAFLHLPSSHVTDTAVLQTVCDRPALSTFIGTNFPTVFAYFVSLCHILITLAMFQTFPFLLYFLWWSVICHLWCYYWCRECSGNSQRTSIIRAWNVTELLQSHDDNLNKWGVASYRWAKEMISWNAVYSWWRCCEYCLNDSKGLKIIS